MLTVARVAFAAAIALAAPACTSNGTSEDRASATPGGATAPQASELVECELPSQIRQLGTTTFLAPRQRVRTTVLHCAQRGGSIVDAAAPL